MESEPMLKALQGQWHDATQQGVSYSVQEKQIQKISNGKTVKSVSLELWDGKWWWSAQNSPWGSQYQYYVTSVEDTEVVWENRDKNKRGFKWTRQPGNVSSSKAVAGPAAWKSQRASSRGRQIWLSDANSVPIPAKAPVADVPAKAAPAAMAQGKAPPPSFSSGAAEWKKAPMKAPKAPMVKPTPLNIAAPKPAPESLEAQASSGRSGRASSYEHRGIITMRTVDTAKASSRASGAAPPGLDPVPKSYRSRPAGGSVVKVPSPAVGFARFAASSSASSSAVAPPAVPRRDTSAAVPRVVPPPAKGPGSRLQQGLAENLKAKSEEEGDVKYEPEEAPEAAKEENVEEAQIEDEEEGLAEEEAEEEEQEAEQLEDVLQLMVDLLQDMPREERLPPSCASFCPDWVLLPRACDRKGCPYAHGEMALNWEKAVGWSNGDRAGENHRVAALSVLGEIAIPAAERRAFVSVGGQSAMAAVKALQKHGHKVFASSPAGERALDTLRLRNLCFPAQCTVTAALNAAAHIGASFGCVYLDYSVRPPAFFQDQANQLRQLLAPGGALGLRTATGLLAERQKAANSLLQANLSERLGGLHDLRLLFGLAGDNIGLSLLSPDGALVAVTLATNEAQVGSWDPVRRQIDSIVAEGAQQQGQDHAELLGEYRTSDADQYRTVIYLIGRIPLDLRISGPISALGGTRGTLDIPATDGGSLETRRGNAPVKAAARRRPPPPELPQSFGVSAAGGAASSCSRSRSPRGSGGARTLHAAGSQSVEHASRGAEHWSANHNLSDADVDMLDQWSRRRRPKLERSRAAQGMLPGCDMDMPAAGESEPGRAVCADPAPRPDTTAAVGQAPQAKIFQQSLQGLQRQNEELGEQEPPLALLSLRGFSCHAVAVRCDGDERQPPFSDCQMHLTACLQEDGTGDEDIQEVYDSGGGPPAADLDVPMADEARAVHEALQRRGGAWSQTFWQLLSYKNVLGVGVGTNARGGKGKRPRAARLALAVALRLDQRSIQDENAGAENVIGDPDSDEKWKVLDGMVDRLLEDWQQVEAEDEEMDEGDGIEVKEEAEEEEAAEDEI